MLSFVRLRPIFRQLCGDKLSVPGAERIEVLELLKCPCPQCVQYSSRVVPNSHSDPQNAPTYTAAIKSDLKDRGATSQADLGVRAAMNSQRAKDLTPTEEGILKSTTTSKNSRKQPIPTHFLALPLVTSHSLPQLATSIAQFQSITTAPRPLRPSEIQASARNRAQETPERDFAGSTPKYLCNEGKKEAGDAISIIPAQAHRPPGTMHLTLGTMVLENEEVMRSALEVLKRVDFRAMLSAAEPHRDVVVADESTTTNPAETNDCAGPDGTTTIEAGEDVASALRTLDRPISPPEPNFKSTTVMTPADKYYPPPIKIDLKGLNAFPSPKKSRVFYATPYDASNRLQNFAEAVQQRFIEEGIVRKEGRALTLHATVANLKYVKTPRWQGAGSSGGRGLGKGSGRREVDARSMIEVFDRRGGLLDAELENNEAFVWAADIVVDRIRICKMGAVESQDGLKEKEYPAIFVPVDDSGGGKGEAAEVVFA